ncbi:surface-adhesin E family protein [Cupriavidus basilensis]
MFFRIFRCAAVLFGCAVGVAAHAESGIGSRQPPRRCRRPVPMCPQPSGATVFRSTPRAGCAVVAAPDPSAPDPQRWMPMMGANGVISYFDQVAVKRAGPEVGVVVMRNAPAGVIRTTSGDPIRSSLKRMVLNCASSMFAVVEQTLYSKRFAKGEALYTIRAPEYSRFQPAATGSVAAELLRRLCR